MTQEYVNHSGFFAGNTERLTGTAWHLFLQEERIQLPLWRILQAIQDGVVTGRSAKFPTKVHLIGVPFDGSHKLRHFLRYTKRVPVEGRFGNDRLRLHGRLPKPPDIPIVAHNCVEPLVPRPGRYKSTLQFIGSAEFPLS